MAISGEEGNFTVVVKKHPRYVDMDKCIACGICAEKCPKKVDDPYNMGVSKRKAAYIKYGQTVPLKYAIDGENCIYFTKKGKCRACEKYCPTGAINFHEKEVILPLNVGAVVLAPGFKPFDPTPYENFGYKKVPDVVTGLEYERLLSAGGPCLGHLTMPSTGREPEKIAWIQCVGSRDISRSSNGYCSTVCCMYAMKQALATAEHLSGKNLERTVFYMDIRTQNKEFERYYETAREKGVRFIRSRPHTVEPGYGNTGVQVEYVQEDGIATVEDFDMLILSIGMEPPQDAEKLAYLMDCRRDSYGFIATHPFDPAVSSRKGIYLAGAAQAPKAIPRSVTEASAAAAEAARSLASAKASLTTEKTYPPERDISQEPPRVGVFVCACGINIASTVDVNQLAAYARSLPGVALVENNLFTCSTDTQVLMAEKIREHNLNRIVVAACTPRTHEPLFQDTLRECGLNPYLLEMANIRNHNSWVHVGDPEKATEKAKDQVRMAVAKAALNEALEQPRVNVIQQAMVVGGGLAGMSAAINLADQGHQVALIEKSHRLGGVAWRLTETWNGMPVRPYLMDLIHKTENHPHIKVYKNARIKTCKGSVGEFSSDVESKGRTRTLNYGAAVFATGAHEYEPREYLYGQDPRIMTHLQFDAEKREHPEGVTQASSVVFIQCVGSREPERPYCSRVCCTHTVHTAAKLKEMNPDMDVYVLNRDMRTYGEREDLYRKARQSGVIFIRFTRHEKPKVLQEKGALFVEVHDPILQRPLKLPADYLVLATAIVPNDIHELVDLYKCGLNEDGFLNQAHPKLRPVDMPVDGLFLAGLCNYPKPIDEAISQGKAAAARAGVILSRSIMQLDAVKSYVTEKCDGCALCVDVCPYAAIRIEEYGANGHTLRKVATDSALCKGCGLCEATCPKEGILVHGFTLPQLKAQVDAALDG